MQNINKYHAIKKNGFTLIELLVGMAIAAILLSLASGDITKAFFGTNEATVNSHITTLIAETKSIKDRNGYGDGKANVNLIPILIKREKIPTSMKKDGDTLKNDFGGEYTNTSTTGGFGYEVGTTNIPAAICISTVSMQAKAGIASTTKINSNTFNGPVSNAQAEAACNQDKNTISFVVIG